MQHCLVRAMYPSASDVALSTRGAVTNVELYLFLPLTAVTTVSIS